MHGIYIKSLIRISRDRKNVRINQMLNYWNYWEIYKQVSLTSIKFHLFDECVNPVLILLKGSVKVAIFVICVFAHNATAVLYLFKENRKETRLRASHHTNFFFCAVLACMRLFFFYVLPVEWYNLSLYNFCTGLKNLPSWAFTWQARIIPSQQRVNFYNLS